MRTHREDGFGLVEVMVASVILAIVGAAISILMTSSFKASSQATDTTTWNALAQRARVALEDNASCHASLRSMSTFRPQGFQNLNSVAAEIVTSNGSKVVAGPFPKKLGHSLRLNQVRATPFLVAPNKYLVRFDIDADNTTLKNQPASATYVPPTRPDSPTPKKATFVSYATNVTFLPNGQVNCLSDGVNAVAEELDITKNSITNQKQTIHTLETQVNQLRRQIQDLTQEVTSLKSAIGASCPAAMLTIVTGRSFPAPASRHGAVITHHLIKDGGFLRETTWYQCYDGRWRHLNTTTQGI